MEFHHENIIDSKEPLFLKVLYCILNLKNSKEVISLQRNFFLTTYNI